MDTTQPNHTPRTQETATATNRNDKPLNYSPQGRQHRNKRHFTHTLYNDPAPRPAAHKHTRLHRTTGTTATARMVSQSASTHLPLFSSDCASL